MHDWIWSINTKDSPRAFILIRRWQSQKPKPEDNKRRVGRMRHVAYVRPKTQVNYRTDPILDKKIKKKHELPVQMEQQVATLTDALLQC